MKGAEQAVSGILNLATSSSTAAVAATGLAEANAALNAAQAALLAPVTAMIAESTQLAAVLIANVAGFGEMAAAEGLATAATVTLESALALLASPLVVIVGLLAALVAGVAIAGKGLEAFSKSEAAIGRLAIELRDMGNVFPAEELVAFSHHLQDMTGIAHTAIERLGGLAASFGFTRAQIEKTIPVAIDIGVARGLDPEQVLRRIFMAATGRKQGLVALGIDPNKVKGDVHDVNNLLEQLSHQFRGTAEAFRNTLPGTTEALKNSVSRFFEAIGRFISPVVVPLLNLFIFAIDQAAALLKAIADFLHIPTAADLGKGKANELALKGDPEQTAALQGIEKNTAVLDPFIKHVLGGKGDVARRSVTWRDTRMAWGI